MRLKFWGTRGSIPKPGPTTVRYGGNTSCLELRSAKGTVLVIDCGTGGHSLGLKLISESSYQRGHMLIGHTHWDHIQGIPFFAPFFKPDAEWDIYGPRNLNQSIQEVLEGQMQHIYFPIAITQFNATMHYHSLVEGEFEIDDIKITAQYLNHPILTCGYRIEVDGVVIVYSCDHEPHTYTPHQVDENKLSGEDYSHLKFLANADLVIHDAQYTPEEYADKIGWGHSTFEYAVNVCQQAGVKQLALTHHEPTRCDEDIDKILNLVHKKLKEEGSPLKVFAAAEGDEVELISTPKTAEPLSKDQPSAYILSDAILTEQSIVACITDPQIASVLHEAAQISGVHLQITSSFKETSELVLAKKIALVIIEHNPPMINGLDLCSTIRKNQVDISNDQLPIVLIASEDDTEAGIKAGVTDWLLFPFSWSYARSKIQAWILRESCSWIKKPIR